ncbi:phospholipid-translocating atpase [Moniliophthora roreri MCA 2997]|uniref:Phospholipid-transporting ATPase n=2 Tax=Moniliophthora roreri TaxID=221103 RepID=V2XUJ0_MONRO|nr:phospholipid-translocating atpase [Moniliophthora roreri MCA 2997]KAI3619691.1 phospholipid-translocating atpase [Moniliophthora roreri]
MAKTKTKTEANPLVVWFNRLVNFKLEDLFTTKRPPGPPRTVHVNENLPADYLDHRGKVKREHVYCTNQVITSKYTILTFVPRNFLEQFRRIANIYFAGIAILQFFPKFSTISPGVVVLPLVIIIGLTALKDGYEDYRRHQSDQRINQSVIKVLRGGSWVNPNITKGKSKTFVRGLIPKSTRRPRAVSSAAKAVAPDVSSTSIVKPDTPLGELDLEGGTGDGPYWENILWEDLRVGDFVMITDNEAIPADILICATSDEENVAYVETKNLDGETNLKSRNAVAPLTHLRTAADCANTINTFRVSCDRPENNMYRLNAMVEFGEKKYPVDLQTTLLRGTVLKNTSWVIGVVLFTGEDSKVVMNAGDTPSKRSKVERQMNPQVMINLILIFVMAAICAIVDSTLEKEYYPLGAPWLFGADQSDDNPSINGIITFAFALLTFQILVPISLYLTIEVVRTVQSIFIYLDYEMYYEKKDQPTQARSWNLTDDLGQIEYIFSDKTGTLTQNMMVFRQCSIGGKAYRGDPEPEVDLGDQSLELKKNLEGEKTGQTFHVGVTPSRPSDSDATSSKPPSINQAIPTKPKGKDPVPHFYDSELAADIEAAYAEEPDSEIAAHARMLNGFFSVLALCHTVLASVDPATGSIEYKAQSPDEAALVQAAADVGFVFLGRDKETLSLRTPSSPDGEPEKYELLNILEFTSARKRMSVILRKLDNEDSRVFLLCKGADNVIFDRLKAGGDDLKEETERHLSDFANEGLRTLTLAYKVIPDDEYEAWAERYHDASVAMDDRETKIEVVSEEIEKDLRLLGATAIEDKLQDGVPEAIADLKRAGIKIWVATGDKLETAIAIGRSTNLVSPDSNIIIVRGGGRPVQAQLRAAIEQFFPETSAGMAEVLPRSSMSSQPGLHRVNTGVSSIVGPENGERPGGFILVIDGAALLHAFESEENKALLLRLGTLCEGVICCRVSPLQKALVVRLVKDGLKAMTLAIGDGANDVSMIQAADVGVGISGEEGLQAVNSSDYAIAQFRFLKKLLLVHGHWSYARNGTMILNFFYKNIVPIGVLWWYQIYCGWSATFVFDYAYILFWNSIWTIAPVAGIGVADRILDDRILMDLPELYHYGRERHYFSFTGFFLYMLDGAYQSVIIYFFAMYTYITTSARSDGYDVSVYEWSTTAAVTAVMVADIFTGMAASAWTWWLVFFVFIGIVIVWLYTLIYSAIPPSSTWTFVYGNYFYLCTSVYFWLGLVLLFILSLTPRFIAKAYQASLAPGDIDIVRYIKKNDPYADLSTRDSEVHLGIGLTEMKKRRNRVSRASSMADRISRRSSRSSVMTIERYSRPGTALGVRSASRMDMSTGMLSTERGFDFATEENGPAIKRIQTNLSERRLSSRNLPATIPDSPGKKGKASSSPGGGHSSRMFSLKRGFKKKKPHSPPREEE